MSAFYDPHGIGAPPQAWEQIELFPDLPSADALSLYPTNLEDCILRLEELESRIAFLDNELKNARAHQRYLSDHALNELLPDDVVWDKRKHTTMIELPRTGTTVKLRKELHCSVAKDAREEAHSYLQEIGHGDLLKYQLVIQFPRKMLDVARSTYTSLRKLLDEVVTIEGSTELAGATMAAWVRAELKAGRHVPDCFGVHTTLRVVKDESPTEEADV